jgi:endonuclease/exonuclease/phosphatase (EEP) superfamily protein YafD
VVATVCALAGLALLLLVLAPDLQARHQFLAMSVSFAPYGWVLWLVAVVVGVASTRRRLVVVPLALGLAAHSFLLLPYLPGAPSAVAGQLSTVGVLELNLNVGLADTGQLAAQIDQRRPDVVVLAEVTDSTLKTLNTAA